MKRTMVGTVFGLFVSALGATGCLTGGSMTETFRARIANGCKTEQECEELVREAESKLVACQARFVKFVDACDEQSRARDEATASKRSEHEERSAREQRAAQLELSKREAEAREVARLAAEEAQRREAALAAEAERTSCAADREARMRAVKTFNDQMDLKDAAHEWWYDHCKSIDNSVAVTRVVQDSRGEYHWVEGRDRGVDIVCDAKTPPAIAQARKLVVKFPDEIRQRNVMCQRWDADAEENPRSPSTPLGF